MSFIVSTNATESKVTSNSTSFLFDYPCGSPTTCYPIKVALRKGTYFIEVWGASGGSSGSEPQRQGGKGGYTSGIIPIQKETEIFLYVGGAGQKGGGYDFRATPGGFNGGGKGAAGSSSDNAAGPSGGGSSDCRFSDGTRFIVAGSGGGAGYYASYPTNNLVGGFGGGNNGGSGGSHYRPGSGGTQTSNGFATGYESYTKGDKGNGGNAFPTPSYGSGGGGGGYFGGGGGASSGGGGGSGYLDPKYQGSTIPGSDPIPTTNGISTEPGHYGNGAIRITTISRSPNNNETAKTSKSTSSLSIYFFILIVKNDFCL